MPGPSKERLPRNVWVVSAASFLTDLSSEMVLNLLPLFLSNVLGVKTATTGLIEGVAESTASFVKAGSGWYSDKWQSRKWPTVFGYGLSTVSKAFFLIASNWGLVAGVRWADRVGKGIRTAPRDALVADSVSPAQRGYAFGIHRAADTLGAVGGILGAIVVVWAVSPGGALLDGSAFRWAVLISLVPAVAAVLVLAVFAKDVPTSGKSAAPRLPFRSLGKRFWTFLAIAAVFDLGNSSDAFLILRAQERGLGVIGILALLAGFNVVYTLISIPAGVLSDRIGRFRLLAAGWITYAVIYAGFALSQTATHICVAFLLYGIYFGLTQGVTRAYLADLVQPELRGTAYGAYNGVMGLIDLPASIIAGILWQGLGEWQGYGAPAPFFYGSAMALLAAALLTIAHLKDRPAAPE